jgi:hypothetical protein
MAVRSNVLPPPPGPKLPAWARHVAVEPRTEGLHRSLHDRRLHRQEHHIHLGVPRPHYRDSAQLDGQETESFRKQVVLPRRHELEDKGTCPRRERCVRETRDLVGERNSDVSKRAAGAILDRPADGAVHDALRRQRRGETRERIEMVSERRVNSSRNGTASSGRGVPMQAGRLSKWWASGRSQRGAKYCQTTGCGQGRARIDNDGHGVWRRISRWVAAVGRSEITL